MPPLRELISRAVIASIEGALGELARQCGEAGFPWREARSAGELASSVFANLAGQQGDAIDWCRTHNAAVRFESDGTVSVRVNGIKRRRPALVDAVVALRDVLDRGAEHAT